MSFVIQAACMCDVGKRRKNNEDNFCFDRKILEEINNGLNQPVTLSSPLHRGTFFAVFDGMGGENFGESASFAAAEFMQKLTRKLTEYFIPEREFLNAVCLRINDAVVEKQQQLCTDRMGSTMAALYFSNRHAYVCNIGDSRVYRLRERVLLRLSEDHVEKREGEKKTPLTQYLGINPQEMLIEPHIAKSELVHGDLYLLCSDGLTDMLTDFEIAEIMTDSEASESCVQNLVDAAMEKGGKDNITVIVCRIA